MTVSSGTLRALAAKAQPLADEDIMDLVEQEEAQVLVEGLRLLADTMDTIEPLAHPGSEWQVLLARFRALEERAGGQTEGRAGDGR